MKKILWLIILLFTLYIVLIFKAPSLASELEKLMGINGFNEKITSIKTKMDKLGVKVPTKSELEGYASGAIDSIEKTKENIDNARKKANEIKATYDDTKEKINEAGEKFNEIKNTVDKIGEIGDSLNKVISSTGTVN